MLAGPTASGKTTLAISLARALEGEIISADSRQIYKGLDIGTAKPAPCEQALVKHYLIDIIEPAERYNAGSFSRDASSLIEKLARDGKTAIVCGGTGFYLEALTSPFFEEPEVPEDKKNEVRGRLEEMVSSKGPAALHSDLARIDPERAERLHPNDSQRVSRALELFYLTGRTMTELLSASEKQSPYRPFTVLLEPQSARLRESIAGRSRRMLEGGWIGEVENLLASGIPVSAPGFQSLGYMEVISLVRGEINRTQALDAVIAKTWQYARRQRTWFRRSPAQVRNAPDDISAAKIISLWREHAQSFKGTR
ncbi:MAG: tRNA (adenosine(37)-N6)-dimethylallyltransferase MiaA [Gemmatimonadota bacterium]|nr:tRNA (adenosine(37)-N6)-dimethylallyltransferase MiaA [Gemmatimonadota bacterium]